MDNVLSGYDARGSGKSPSSYLVDTEAEFYNKAEQHDDKANEANYENSKGRDEFNWIVGPIDERVSHRLDCLILECGPTVHR